MKFRTPLTVISTLILLVSVTGFTPLAVQAAPAQSYGSRTRCDYNSDTCTETAWPTNYAGQYTGHDEPSVLYYSNQAGSGNSNVYRLTLPKDPPTLPTQNGTGGTFNFQLHPAFWFGMAMCDTQSYPEYTNVCTPDSDSNIFDNGDPTAADYISKHPGAAFMEMQFYPPGWASWPAGNSCDGTKWCAALNIDSFSASPNTGAVNNAVCLNTVGEEYVNFAFITRSGVPQAPANPVDATLATYTPDPSQDLFMNSGDKLVVDMHDTANGFQVVIHDLTTKQTGSMVASAANSFGQVKFDPTATTCTNIPYNFHPMYATSSEHTRVPWAAHSYNVAFSDEIGHFEYCNAVDANGNCTQAGVTDLSGVDADDVGCFGADDSTRIQISGCLGTDSDFDGPEYGLTWPGTFTNPAKDRAVHPSSIVFSSPLFTSSGGSLTNYARVAFETDLSRIESSCDRFNTGSGCVNPPPGASFYPIYSTRGDPGECLWQLGGPYIPGTLNTFGGNSTAEYGPLLQLHYASPSGDSPRYNDFRQVLSNNPCTTSP